MRSDEDLQSDDYEPDQRLRRLEALALAGNRSVKRMALFVLLLVIASLAGYLWNYIKKGEVVSREEAGTVITVHVRASGWPLARPGVVVQTTTALFGIQKASGFEKGAKATLELRKSGDRFLCVSGVCTRADTFQESGALLR